MTAADNGVSGTLYLREQSPQGGVVISGEVLQFKYLFLLYVKTTCVFSIRSTA